MISRYNGSVTYRYDLEFSANGTAATTTIADSKKSPFIILLCIRLFIFDLKIPNL